MDTDSEYPRRRQIICFSLHPRPFEEAVLRVKYEDLLSLSHLIKNTCLLFQFVIRMWILLPIFEAYFLSPTMHTKYQRPQEPFWLVCIISIEPMVLYVFIAVVQKRLYTTEIKH